MRAIYQILSVIAMVSNRLPQSEFRILHEWRHQVLVGIQFTWKDTSCVALSYDSKVQVAYLCLLL